MKTLFITSQFPYPLDNGGKIGAFNGISVVSYCEKVTVLSFTEDEQRIEEGLEYLKETLKNVDFKCPINHQIHIRNKPFLLIKTMLYSYVSGIPYVSAKFYNKQMYKMIDNCFKNEVYDNIFIDYLNMYPYANYIKNKYKGNYKRIIFKDHNVEFEIVKQEMKKNHGWRRFVLDYEWKRTKEYEINSIKDNDLVFTVCVDNTGYFNKYSNNVFSMMPTYKIINTRRAQVENKSILYIGNLSWKPNMDGLIWFVKHVWPKIKESVPSAKFDIVGSGKIKNTFRGVEGVSIIGYVDNLTDLYNNHQVLVVPLFEGSGIRIKILEAFNNDIPVVSTKVGCTTIGATHNNELVIADSTQDFSAAVCELLQSEDLKNLITANAKKFLESNYSLLVRQIEYQKILKKNNS